MEGVQIISVSDLLHHSRPLTGTASLQPPTPSSPPLKKHKPHPPDENPTKLPLPLPLPLSDQNPNPRAFSPLTRPVILIGTIGLPSEDADQCFGPQSHCFSFSDASSSVYCTVLDLDIKMIGRTVHVLAWNFVPFKHRIGGVLEVIRWSLPSLGEAASLHHGSFLSIPSHYPFQEEHSVCRSRFFCGALVAVSPVFRVPCRNPADGIDSIGFLAEMITCSCNLCSNSLSVVDHFYRPQEKCNHSLTKQVFIYFLGHTSCWRPVLTDLIEKLITISGLKKKLIFVGGDEPYLMFVTTVKTVVSLCRLPVERAVNERKSDDGIYVGVVTGVYMQCMVVELDEKVWLSITDPQLALQHSLRIGAIVSVRNFHLVCPKFSWTKMLLLGTYARTSISVQSFSPSDTRCYFRNQTQSLLGKFIESLICSARFWVLLLASCFRMKFARIFSDKEIFGSKYQEGLVQIYARASLPSSAFQLQHGVFMEFCKHDQCTFKNESKLGPLNLVTPISNFISECEAIWVSVISQIQNDAETVGNSDGNHLYCEGASSCCTIKRIISSKDLGFILMGTLKISPSSGRLQLADSTGSVDVVVPDLLSNIDGQSIHEVKDYKLIIEGLPTQLVSLGSHSSEPLSCKNIFEQFSYRKVLDQVTVYVHYFLRDSTCLNVPSHMPSCNSRRTDLRGGSGEVYHLLLVTHKFPGIENDGPNLSNISSLFAEALVVPYNLILQEEPECNQHTEMFQGNRKAQTDNVVGRQDPVKGWSGRPSLVQVTSEPSLSVSNNNFEEVERSPKKIPCLLTFRSNNLEESSVPAFLCHTDAIALENIAYNQWAQRILLEFNLGSFCKYQLLHPSAYYILRCSKGFLCSTKGCEEMNCGKALVNSQTTLWSLSFSSSKIMHQREPPLGSSSGISSARVGTTVSGEVSQNELIFRQPLGKMHGTSDVHLHFSSEATGPMKEEVEAVEDGLIRLLNAACELLSVSSCIQMMAELARPFAAADPRSRRLSQGNLISLRGNIENMHNYSCKSKSYLNSEHANINQRKPCNLCLHVYDGNHMVRICGNFSKSTYPVGMGPGANATFNRVLMTCGSSRCRKLLLTPVSYVVINSIKESGHQHADKRSLSPFRDNIVKENFFDMVSLALISQLIQRVDGTLVWFRCRVVSINILVFERHSEDYGKSQSRRQLKMPVVNIPFAGFVLDDGSSFCCCWADAGRAETLLRLHETAYRSYPISRKRSTTSAGSKTTRDTTVGHQLEKILKKHQRVVVRNHGAIPYSQCRDFSFSVDSDEIFSKTDESLLRYIVLNACAGSTFNIMGCCCCCCCCYTNGLEWLDAESQVALQSMRNIWVREVGDVNHLEEARNLMMDS